MPCKGVQFDPPLAEFLPPRPPFTPDIWGLYRNESRATGESRHLGPPSSQFPEVPRPSFKPLASLALPSQDGGVCPSSPFSVGSVCSSLLNVQPGMANESSNGKSLVSGIFLEMKMRVSGQGPFAHRSGMVSVLPQHPRPQLSTPEQRPAFFAKTRSLYGFGAYTHCDFGDDNGMPASCPPEELAFWKARFNFNIIDRVNVPADLPEGDYPRSE
eukprot:gene13660-biopygen5719